MARYKASRKEETRERILEAAGRCFRKGGYNGIGVDGLAQEAGVTSGAFYGHFDSKLAAFSAAIADGMAGLGASIAALQQQHGDQWWKEFASFYMNQRRTCDLAESCVLQSLTPEVGRSDEAMRTMFQSELLRIVASACGAGTQEAMDRTWASLAMLTGGVTLARAVADEDLAREIALAVQNAVIALQTSRQNTPTNPQQPITS